MRKNAFVAGALLWTRSGAYSTPLDYLAGSGGAEAVFLRACVLLMYNVLC